ncbi:MAG: hypothetical protein J5772_00065 [Clostridia bacterium]|nr:hypothetical protein [Clostridia bacterium]
MERRMAEDFLWFSYFGITKSDAESDKNCALNACIQRAYLDLCRTIRYKNNTQSIEKGIRDKNPNMICYSKKKKDFICSINNSIHSAINGELLIGKKLSSEEFERWHYDLCNTITEADHNSEVLKDDSHLQYGQAQKWINMSVKYMLVMGLWDEYLDVNLDLFHVPLDSLVFSAAKISLGIDNKYDSWSRLQEQDYKDYQQKIREKVECPIKWEWDAWIEQAKREKKEPTND